MADPKDRSRVQVFDGHNDVLSRLQNDGLEALDQFRSGRTGHIDLPKAQAGGLAGGFFAIFVGSPGADSNVSPMEGAEYDHPLPPQLDRPYALDRALGQCAILHRLQGDGALRICTTTQHIRDAMSDGTMAAIMHMEGAEAIDADFLSLDVLYAAGLRSLGPVWSRPTVFGHGVPFRYPSDGNTGAGLTDDGKRLVRRCNELGVMIDLSHLNASGVRDVAEVSDAPLVATHSNAHALCPHARNLTDDQLRMIAESRGVVGLNFAAGFLRKDGQMVADVPLEVMVRHLDHMIGIVGEEGVALGSDFDGATIPQDIGSAAGLPALVDAMDRHGFGAELIQRIAHGNWLRVLSETWHEVRT